jgi:hypothetical protein
MNQINLFIISFKLRDVAVIRKQVSKNNEHTCISKHLKKKQLFILSPIQEFQLFQVLQMHSYIF